MVVNPQLERSRDMSQGLVSGPYGLQQSGAPPDLTHQFLLRAQEMQAACGPPPGVYRGQMDGGRYVQGGGQNYAYSSQPPAGQFSQSPPAFQQRVVGGYPQQAGGGPVPQNLTGLPQGFQNNLMNLARLGGAGPGEPPRYEGA